VTARVARRDAVARHDDTEVAHVRVVRREEHAHLGRHARDHDRLGAEVAEQELERRVEEARMLRLHDEIVALGRRRDQLDDRAAARARARAVPEETAKVRPPATEVVVHPDDRNAGAARGGEEPREPFRHRQRPPEEQIAFREVQVVDDVDDQERDVAGVRCAAVQIALRRPHGEAR
jgi:hypothetical protein